MRSTEYYSGPSLTLYSRSPILSVPTLDVSLLKIRTPVTSRVG